jgi:hypothetical protein
MYQKIFKGRDMKKRILTVCMLLSFAAFAETPCDVRPGTSIGLPVIEFITGHVIHSKMNLSESSPDALLEEMTNLQDMGVCEEKIIAKKCLLKFEKVSKINFITLYRGPHKWIQWNLKAKDTAQNYVKNLKRVGFCS